MLQNWDLQEWVGLIYTFHSLPWSPWSPTSFLLAHQWEHARSVGHFPLLQALSVHPRYSFCPALHGAVHTQGVQTIPDRVTRPPRRAIHKALLINILSRPERPRLMPRRPSRSAVGLCRNGDLMLQWLGPGVREDPEMLTTYMSCLNEDEPQL